MQSFDNTSGPVLESWAARIGIIALTGVSCWINAAFWMERGDLAAAGLTVAAELVALGGLGVAIHHGARNWGKALGGVLVTLAAAGWCGLSMYEKLAHEAQGRAVAAVEASPSYRDAADDLALARSLYTAALQERVPDAGPQTTQARSAELSARVDRLKAERDQAQARLEAMKPQAAIDPMSAARGFGIELAKLIGLVVFGFGAAPRKETKAAEPELSPAQKLAFRRWGTRPA